MASSILQAGAEASLLFTARAVLTAVERPFMANLRTAFENPAMLLLRRSENGARRPIVLIRRFVFVLAALAVACSKPSNPTAPDVSQNPYLGTWRGVVNNAVIGPGDGAIVLDGELQSRGGSLYSGHWSFVFSESRFSASGTVSGSLLPDGTALVLLFSASTVPCPGAVGQIDQKGKIATLTVTSNRMQGSYIDNGCPGGTMDLVRR